MKKRFVVKKNDEFNKIIHTCPYVKDSNLVIYYKDSSLGYSRYGISVGTKFGHAVLRNLYKRRLRMIIHQNKNNYEKDKDYIIIIRKNCLNVEYDDICKSYCSLMKKIHHNHNVKGEFNET